jgi:transposase
MSNIKVLGIDIAKNVFQLHGTDSKGKCLLRRRYTRKKLKEFIANLAPCIIGMEACGGAHYWGRLFQEYGHEVRLMAPQFVKPYVKSNKNDKNDAQAIAEACSRAHMRYVSVKTIGQQDIAMLHRSRELAIKHRTSLSNQIRSMLHEYGVVIEKGKKAMKQLMESLALHEAQLSPSLNNLVKLLYRQYVAADKQVGIYEKEIEALAKTHGVYKELQKLPGVGPLIASAILATVGDANTFKKGREMSAWLGLTPKQHSSGHKIKLGGITKRGDRYMRKLLVQGARTVVRVCDKKPDKLHRWVSTRLERGGFNKAAVALANKNARMIWAIMVTGECYREPEVLNA